MIESVTGRVLVKLVEVEEKKSALIIPSKEKEYQIGIVVSSDIYEDEVYVWSRKYAGLILEHDGVDYVSLHKDEILAWSDELK